jgi:hypothetical protein
VCTGMCIAILAFRLDLSMAKNSFAYPLDDPRILVMVNEEMREVCHGLRGLEKAVHGSSRDSRRTSTSRPSGRLFLLALL